VQLLYAVHCRKEALVLNKLETEGKPMETSRIDKTSSTAAAVWIALVSGLGGLVLGGAAFVSSLDDDERDREFEQRLVCLELPGPNDCGIDGR
jgi:hypothetical protein